MLLAIKQIIKPVQAYLEERVSNNNREILCLEGLLKLTHQLTKDNNNSSNNSSNNSNSNRIKGRKLAFKFKGMVNYSH